MRKVYMNGFGRALLCRSSITTDTYPTYRATFSFSAIYFQEGVYREQKVSPATRKGFAGDETTVGRPFEGAPEPISAVKTA